MKRFLLSLIAVFSMASPFFGEEVDSGPPGYKEIPYYLRKLEETQLEDERVRFNKLVHDAVVNANLADKKVVREMETLMDRIQKDMDSGLDRMSITGQTYWLASAVEYFEREKLQPIADVPETDWLTTVRPISTFPDKVMLFKNGKSEQITEDTNIHEAILSPDGRWLAYYRLIEPQGKKAEIWLVNTANKKKKKVASMDSCYTLLFSKDGGKIFFQLVPAAPKAESEVFVLSRGGGKPRAIAKATLLQTLVEKGPYQGNLILYRHNLHHLGVSQLECPYVYSEGGKNLGRLVNTACR